MSQSFQIIRKLSGIHLVDQYGKYLIIRALKKEVV